MSEKYDRIDELFQERFNGFEADVDPGVWQAIESQIPQASTPVSDGGASASSGKLILGQFSTSTVVTVASIAAAAVIAFGIYTFNSEEETPAIPEQELVEQEPIIEQPEPANEPEQHVQEELIVEQDDHNLKEEGSASDLVNEQNNTAAEIADIVQNDVEPTASGEQDLANTENEKNSLELNKTPNERSSENNDLVEEKVPDNNEPQEQEAPNEEIVPAPAPEIILADIEHFKVEGEPFSVKFNNTGQGSYHEWLIDGVMSIEDDPEFTFDGPGEYPVKLTVRSQDGRTHTDETFIRIIAPSVLNEIPNVFSPNGDNMNETLDISGENMEKVTIQVFNMNSKLVFQSNSFENDWSGNDMSGRPLPEGNYVVTVEAIGQDGERHPGNAIVSLLR